MTSLYPTMPVFEAQKAAAGGVKRQEIKSSVPHLATLWHWLATLDGVWSLSSMLSAWGPSLLPTVCPAPACWCRCCCSSSSSISSLPGFSFPRPSLSLSLSSPKMSSTYYIFVKRSFVSTFLSSLTAAWIHTVNATNTLFILHFGLLSSANWIH